MKMKIELCVGSVEALKFATNFPFDRIELCQALESGGLTPSTAMFKTAKKETKKEIHVLIRPRIGNFNYSSAEKKLLLNEINHFIEQSCSGIVVGALDKNNKIDRDFMGQLTKNFPAVNFTFHRAFDQIKDKKEAINHLIDLGFNRILTSGTKSNISDNMSELIQLNKYAESNIELMIGGGITPINVKEIISKIKPQAIHFSGTIQQKSKLKNDDFSEPLLIASETKIRAILEEIL
jgi:copper homeostasis protein